MEELLLKLSEVLLPYVSDPTTLVGAIFLAVIGLFNVLKHVLPAPDEDSSAWYKGLIRVIDFCATNFLKAKNAVRV